MIVHYPPKYGNHHYLKTGEAEVNIMLFQSIRRPCDFIIKGTGSLNDRTLIRKKMIFITLYSFLRSVNPRNAQSLFPDEWPKYLNMCIWGKRDSKINLLKKKGEKHSKMLREK